MRIKGSKSKKGKIIRCPKCGYVSFDYNQVCPKCSKDISAEQEKLNFFPFRPDPPSLLGALTGEANESHVGLRTGGAGGYESMAPDDSMVLDDSALIDGGEDDLQELEISLDTEASGEFETGEKLGPAVEEAAGASPGRSGGLHHAAGAARP